MRHRLSGKTLGRRGEERLQLQRSLCRGLLLSERKRIVTTITKAKWARGAIERCLSLSAKARNLELTEGERVDAARRLAVLIGGRQAVRSCLEDETLVGVNPVGGNVRVLRLAKRRIGDSGQVALVEFCGQK